MESLCDWVCIFLAMAIEPQVTPYEHAHTLHQQHNQQQRVVSYLGLTACFFEAVLLQRSEVRQEEPSISGQVRAEGLALSGKTEAEGLALSGKTETPVSVLTASSTLVGLVGPDIHSHDQLPCA